MYPPKLFAHASLILRTLVKVNFTSLLLPAVVVVIPNLLSLYTCPSKN